MYSLDTLISNFRGCLDYFAATTIIDANYQKYLTTTRLRRAIGSVASALESDEFMKSLHKTMSDFFRLGRWGLLVPYNQLTTELRSHSRSIRSFDNAKLSTESLGTGDKLWELINALRLTRSELADANKNNERDVHTKLVSGAKALHLLLPDLVVPIDRMYTGTFFYRYPEDFSRTAEQQTFRLAFAMFRKLARAVNPEAYVGTQEVHANATKVIDNGIIAFVDCARRNLQTALTQMRTQELAYSLFEKRGRVDGDDLRDWFDAEEALEIEQPKKKDLHKQKRPFKM